MKRALFSLPGLLLLADCKTPPPPPPPPVVVTGITLSESKKDLKEKETFTLQATVAPENATDKSVEWNSDKPDVATVTEGVVTALKAGTAVITVKSKSNTSVTAACQITVIKVVTGITLSESKKELKEKETFTLKATVTPQDATDTSVEWNSDKPDVATVTEGVVTALKAGTATITAKSKSNTALKAECLVTVTAKEIWATSITINPGTPSVLVNATLSLTAIKTPSNALDIIKWSSSDLSKATITSGGIVTGIAVGTVTITAESTKNPAVKGECQLKVAATEVAVTGFSIKPVTVTLFKGRKLTLAKTFEPPGATNQNVTFKSDKEDIASVSNKGEITAQSAGTATITATTEDGKKTAQCTVTVVVPVASIVLTPDPARVSKGSTLTLVAKVEPQNASNPALTYSSSAKDIATVTNDGTVTGVSVGTATITASATDGSEVTGTVMVTVQSNTPTSIPVTSIKLGPNPAKVSTGGTLTLTYEVLPTEATNKAINYTISPAAIATITNAGVVSGVSPGTATVTAIAADGSGVTATLSVTVQSNLATLLSIELGNEKFKVTPAAEGTTVVNHAPHTISTLLATLPVTLTAAANATVKIGDNSFTAGQQVDFSNGATVTFTVTSEDGTATKTYSVVITAYNAASNPYGVYTAAHLNDVRNDEAGSYLMKNNITLPNRDAEGQTATGITDYIEKGWLPIAHDATVSYSIVTEGGFTGIFDGGNFLIDKLYINRSTDCIGLFGVAFGATLKNLGVNGTISALGGSGSKHVGALAGYIKGGSMTNCYASGNVSLTGNFGGIAVYAGGLLGVSYNSGISKSYSSGNISGNNLTGQAGLYIGGFGGNITGDDGTVRDCFATGNFTVSSTSNMYGGGFAGSLTPPTANCYAAGNVEATTRGTAILGGFAGQVPPNRATNCYRNSSATIKSNNKDVASADTSTDTFTSGITAKPKNEISAADLGDAWGQEAGKNEGLPYIKGVGVGK